MLYELRFYDPHPGRLPDLLARFRDRLPPLFARHAIRNIGQWVTDEADLATCSPTPRFAYMTVFQDLAGREAAWAAFGADPQWHRARAESNGATEMLRGYDLFLLRPKDSLVARQETLFAPGLHELLFQRVKHGQDTGFSDWLREVAQPALASAGATLVGCFDLVAGPGLPQSLLWVHWPDAQCTTRANDALRACAEPAPDGHPPGHAVSILMRRIDPASSRSPAS